MTRGRDLGYGQGQAKSLPIAIQDFIDEAADNLRSHKTDFINMLRKSYQDDEITLWDARGAMRRAGFLESQIQELMP